MLTCRFVRLLGVNASYRFLRLALVAIVAFLIAANGSAAEWRTDTIAGTGVAGYSGDGGAARGGSRTARCG